MKKIFAIILVAVMVLGMSSVAFAATRPEGSDSEPAKTTLTIVEDSTYTGERSYEAYQILGANISGAAHTYTVNDKYFSLLLSTLGLPDTAELYSDVIDAIGAKTTAEAMRHFGDDLYRNIIEAQKQDLSKYTPDKSWTVTSTSPSIELDQGYWLIVDVTDLDSNGNADDELTQYSNSLVMIDTVGDSDVTIKNKPSVITTGKKVDDEDDSIHDVAADPNNGIQAVDGEDGLHWQDAADYDIGDEVPFSISGMLPADITSYNYYMFLITDEVGQGLTYIENSLKVYVRGQSRKIGKSGTTDVDFWYDIVDKKDANGNVIGQNLYVYPAYGYKTNTVNGVSSVEKKANNTNGGDFLKLFPAGTDHSEINSSTFEVSYKCLLNENAITGKDGNVNTYTLTFSNNPYTNSLGQTAKDSVIVFTFTAIFNKIDQANQDLKGADFDIYKFIAKPNPTAEEKAKAVKLVDLVTAEATAEAAANGTLIDHPGTECYGYFVKVGDSNQPGVKTTTNEGVQFQFKGIDDGYYRLVETRVPDGYRGIEPIDFHLVADHGVSYIAGQEILNSLTVRTRISNQMDVQGDAATGVYEVDIQNNSGAELPSTGGVGTTIFYILGSVMVLGAVVVLVTKRRMSAEG